MSTVAIDPQGVRAAASALRATAGRLADDGAAPGATHLDPRLVAALSELASATRDLDRWVGTRLEWVATQTGGVAETALAADRFGGT